MVGGDVREELMARRLGIEQARRHCLAPARAVETQEVDARLASGPDFDRAERRARWDLRSGLRGVVYDVNRVICRATELVPSRADLRVPAEERVARLAMVGKVATVAGVALHVASSLAERVLGSGRRRHRLWRADVLRVVPLNR